MCPTKKKQTYFKFAISSLRYWSSLGKSYGAFRISHLKYIFTLRSNKFNHLPDSLSIPLTLTGKLNSLFRSKFIPIISRKNYKLKKKKSYWTSYTCGVKDFPFICRQATRVESKTSLPSAVQKPIKRRLPLGTSKGHNFFSR